MNVPSLISLTRLALSLLIVWFLHEQNYGWALGIFVLGCISDGMDGFFARQIEQTTLGEMIDPLADKVLINAPIITLTLMGHLPVWLCAVVLIRDIGIIIGYFFLKLLDKVSMAKVSGLGQFTTFTQMAFMIFFFWTLFRTSSFEIFVPFIAVACAALTVLSAASYLGGMTKHITVKD